MEPIRRRQIVELKARADAAGDRWLMLYCDSDCLTDPCKRSAMLKARIEYQDALAEFLFLLRAGEPATKK